MPNQGQYVTSYQLASQHGGYSEKEIDILHNLASLLPPAAVVCVEGETDGVETLCIFETVDNVIVCTTPSPFEIDWLIAKHNRFWTVPTSLPKLKVGGLITADYRDLSEWNLASNPNYKKLLEYSWFRVNTLQKISDDHSL